MHMDHVLGMNAYYASSPVMRVDCVETGSGVMHVDCAGVFNTLSLIEGLALIRFCGGVYS